MKPHIIQQSVYSALTISDYYLNQTIYIYLNVYVYLCMNMYLLQNAFVDAFKLTLMHMYNHECINQV